MSLSSAGKSPTRATPLPELHLDHRQVASLFPFHLVFDQTMCIRQIGPSMHSILPDLELGTAFEAYFELQRPSIQPTYQAIEANRGSLFIILSSQRRLRFRGQMVLLPGQHRIALLCSPWLPDQGELLSTGLTFEDFPLHDSMPEFLQVVQAQRLGMEDLRRLSAKLREQREALRESNRKLTEQSSEARKLALIAARTDNGVVVTDAMGCVEWVNEGFVHTTGYTLDEVRGRKPGELLQGPETDAASVALMQQRLRAGEGFQSELINYRKNGTKYWVSIEVQPIRGDNGEIVNYMGIESDITARKEAERRKDLAHAVSDILAESADPEQALQKILHRIMESFGYSFGAVWRIEESQAVLRTVTVLSAEGAAANHMEKTTRLLFLRRGAGLPGKVWAENKAIYLEDWAAGGEHLRREAAEHDGLSSAIAFPIQVAGAAFGVMEFHNRRREKPDDELLKTLTALGNQTGQFLDRNDAEQERRRLVSLLKSTFESTQDGVLVAGLNGQFLSWNQRFLELWGLEHNPPLPGAGREGVLSRAKHLLPNPNEFVRRVEWWYRNPEKSGIDLIPFTDGRVLERATQPQQSEAGLIGRVWNYRDVTQRWLAEKALRESEERYRVISSTASDGITSVNRLNSILFANGAAERMFGFAHGELIGKNLYELMDTGFDDLDPKGLMRVVRGGLINARPKATEVKGRRRNGQEFPLEVTFGKAHIQGQRVLTGVLRDVTERHEAETKLQNALKTLRIAIREAESANRAKSDFLASISHELRTPLNSIAGLSDLLRSAHLSEDQQDMVNTIWASSELLLHLINDLLDVSKIEFGEVDLMQTEFDLIAICEHAIEVVKPRAMGKGLAMALAIRGEMPPLFLGDGNRIRQILINLLGNGVKFTPGGSVTIGMDWTPSGADCAEIILEVQDTGIGIQPEELGKIFEKFYRVDSRDVKRVAGTGLGLSISRKLAQAMGGSLNVSSIPNAGSCFRLQLKVPCGGPLPASNPPARFAIVLCSLERKPLLCAAWQSVDLAVIHCADAAAVLSHLSAAKPCQTLLVDSGSIRLTRHEAARLYDSLQAKSIGAVWIKPIGDAARTCELAGATEIDFPLTPSKMRRALRTEAGTSIPREPNAELQKSLLALENAVSARVLMVEDNPDSAAYAKRVLDLGGHRSTLAATMQAAIDAACDEVYDVIFMDVMLPDGNGFDAANRIREFDKAQGRTHVPIIALTAHALEDYRQQALEAGMDDYLTKPIRKETLTAAIAKWGPKSAPPPAAAEPAVAMVDDDIADLIPKYLARANNDVSAAETLLAQNNFAELRKIGHNFKGSGGGFGFPEISRWGKMLEAASQSADAIGANQALAGLRTYLTDVRWEIKPGDGGDGPH